MKLKFKNLICSTMAAAMLITGISCTGYAAEESSVSVSSSDVKVYIVGDSTACIYGNDDDYAIPRAGWGMYLDKFLNGVEVVDLALAGRSSKSFLAEENYQKLCDELKEGDFLLIQFGHNDAKKSTEEDIANRFTDPEGSTETEGSFKNSLYENYVKLAQERNAVPILFSPVSRRKFKDGKVTDSHGLYDDAVRELAQEEDIAFVDATALTEKEYNLIGFDDARYYHAVYNDMTKGEAGYDNTHFSHLGGIAISCILAGELNTMDTGLEKYIVDDVYEKSAKDAVYGTRGDVAAFLARMVGAVEEGEYSFDDVSADNENYKGIYNAMKTGIVIGNEKKKFNPDDEASLLDIAIMSSRALQYLMGTDSDSADTSIFDDTDVAEYAKAELAYLVESGVIDREKALDFYERRNEKNILAMDVLEELAKGVYDIKAAEVNAQAATEEQSLDELEKVENTK